MKISIDELQAYLADRYSGWATEQGMFMKLVEEIGEVAEVLNKRAGRKASDENDLQEQLGIELADMIHYIVAIAAINDIDLTTLMIEKDKYENIIFCWVMHEQRIIDSILKKLDAQNCDVKCVSLVVDEKTLRERLSMDVERGIRSEDVIERSIARIPMYQALNTIKIDTNAKTVAVIANEIKLL